MIFKRLVANLVQKVLFQGKIIVLYGPRRVGKTTLVKQIIEQYSDQSLYLNCDEPDVRQSLTDKTSTELIGLAGTKKLVVIDEAQRIPNIGLTLKLLVDNAPQIQVIATGSGSFDLSNKINEPLTGRAHQFLLTPLSLGEIYPDLLTANRMLETRLIYGGYPEVVIRPEQANTYLRGLYQNYLYKDALEYQHLKKPELVDKLLSALALQIGGEVSLTELGGLLGVDKTTVARYIYLLEQAFVIFRLPPLSRNLRKEINKTRKIYFWDTGIRNAIINNFNPLSLRNDIGALWENFVIVERSKRNMNIGSSPNCYFWRTWTKQEIDYIEDSGGQLKAFEIKWQKPKKTAPSSWRQAYSAAGWETITKENYWDFLLTPKT
ncbi:ATP-binding protein [Candidatus Collierbacteria bacterium]|nr:ATP-binding protein [Candidatus Collierbacteria bacterium]